MMHTFGLTLLLACLAAPPARAAVPPPAGATRYFSPPAAPPTTADLTEGTRRRIDQAALKTPLEKPAERAVDLAGNFTAWLVRQMTLTDGQEAALAEKVHRRLLKEHRGRVRPAPREAQKVFDRLVKELPGHMRPEGFHFRLTVLDYPEINAFTAGGGRIYVTRGLLDAVLRERRRGPTALAFVLAHELGHVALGHCRRGYQLEALRQEAKRDIALGLDEGRLRGLLETALAPAGRLVTFLYSREQHHRADRFAFQLCRNAGLDLDEALDALRWLVAARHLALLAGGESRPGIRRPSSLLDYYLSTHPDPSLRLKRLLLEHRGTVEEDTRMGLFLYDPQAGRLARAADGVVPAGVPSVVFVPGLHGDERSFDDFLAYLAGRREEVQLLLFRYPNNASLAHAGAFLFNEMTRVVRSPQKASFVCHSAGGLAFRYYAEKRRGGFRRAAFLGTPHAGSRMTALKFLVDAADFIEDLKLGLPRAITATVSEGRGEITPDLHPESLFLRYLGRDVRLARRYEVVYGHYVRGLRKAALRTSFAVGKRLLKELIRDKVPSPLLRDLGLRLADSLRLTEEVLHGDLVVSARSARLEGVRREIETRLHHQALKKDEDVMREVEEWLFEVE